MIRPRHLVLALVAAAAVLVAARFLRDDPPITTAPALPGPRPSPKLATNVAPTTVLEAPPAPAPAVDPDPAHAGRLVARLAALLAAPLTAEGEAELQALERELLALGEAAVGPLGEQLDRAGPAAVRERLFNTLRNLPGPAVEDRLVTEARTGATPAMRTMAMESLAVRRSDRALETLAGIARTDATLPARPLITAPRDPDDPSTELPDEEVFTPRMQAMAALAATRDPRAVAVLVEVVQHGPDESLRMEAARNLAELRADPRAAEALRAAAATDPSPYVRLAALHALDGATDPALVPVLEAIIARDRDAGVRALAQQVLRKIAG